MCSPLFKWSGSLAYGLWESNEDHFNLVKNLDRTIDRSIIMILINFTQSDLMKMRKFNK